MLGHHCHDRYPLYCIVPPHMLRQLAEQGSPLQQERALQALAISGRFRGQRQQIAELVSRPLERVGAGEKQRTVYDAQFQSQLPGRKVRGEGEPPTGDPAADEAYDGSGATFDLYREIYDRNSLDDRGLPLNSTVHYRQGYDNAFWNGEQMAYGDGDEDLPAEERIFNRFTIAIDVIGHELTHGVVQYEAGLVYRDQPGALNEHMADVFGSLVKQRTRQQTAQEADWFVGEGLFTDKINGQGIRSLKAPGTAYNDPMLGKDPQPAHIRDIYTGADDNGGVHINSGIPNHAFYIAAREIGGYAWEKAGRIWYITLRDKLGQTANFEAAANQTCQVAGDLYGNGSLEQQAVRKGWAEVGISLGGGGGEPSPTGGNGCAVLPATLFWRILTGS